MADARLILEYFALLSLFWGASLGADMSGQVRVIAITADQRVDHAVV